MGKREHCGFVGFERYLLGEHYIASCQSTFRNETLAKSNYLIQTIKLGIIRDRRAVASLFGCGCRRF